jgi:steroid delta-isomerase-like uncharacterized protein
MSTKDLKAGMHRLISEWNKGKAAAMAVIDEMYATGVVYHRSTGEDIRGIKGYKQFTDEFFNAFPDNQLAIDDMIVEGDKVATRWTWTGTHKGEYGGIPPTNKKVTMWVISIDHVADGKVVEEWERSDTLGFMQQLGVVPTPEKK